MAPERCEVEEIEERLRELMAEVGSYFVKRGYIIEHGERIIGKAKTHRRLVEQGKVTGREAHEMLTDDLIELEKLNREVLDTLARLRSMRDKAQALMAEYPALARRVKLDRAIPEIIEQEEKLGVFRRALARFYDELLVMREKL